MSQLTVQEILDIADSKLEYSDFGNWHGNDDAIVEFVCECIKQEQEKEKNVLATWKQKQALFEGRDSQPIHPDGQIPRTRVCAAWID